MIPNDSTTPTTTTDQAQAGQTAVPTAGVPTPSATTTPEAATAAVNTATVNGFTTGGAPDAVNTALTAAEQAIHDALKAEAANAQSQQQASSRPLSSAGILSFAHVGMPVQFMPRAIKGNDAPKLMAATIVDVGENGSVDLRVFPRTQAPSYLERDVPPYAGAKQPDGGFYWQLIGGLEG